MNIIKHLYIGILPPPIHKAVTNNIIQIFLYQITQHHDRYPTRLPAKIPNIMVIYH